VAETLRPGPEQAVDGARLQPDHITQALRRLPRRRGQRHRAVERDQAADEHAQRRRLPDSRPARQHEEAAHHGGANSRALLVGERPRVGVVRQPGVHGQGRKLARTPRQQP
jgi:hypothetical protein